MTLSLNLCLRKDGRSYVERVLVLPTHTPAETNPGGLDPPETPPSSDSGSLSLGLSLVGRDVGLTGERGLGVVSP